MQRTTGSAGRLDGKGTEMEREHGGPVIEAVTRFIVDKYETSYGDGFIIVNMWDENGRAYMASIPTGGRAAHSHLHPRHCPR